MSNDKKSVYVKINQDIGTKLEEGLKKPESSNGDDDTTPKDQVYIINDINGLINRMWTDIQVYYYYNNRPEKLEDSGKYMDMLTNSYKNMKVDGDYDFADAYFKLNPNPGDPYTWAQAFCNDDTSDGVRFQGFLDNGNSPSSQIHWCSQFYKWIDGSKSDTGWTYKSKTNYNFMNKYVMGIVKSDSVATFIPEKDPTSPKNKADHQWMVIGDSMNNAHKIYNAYKKYQFSLPQQNLAFNLGNSGFSFDKSDSSLTKINQMGLFGQINTSIMEQKNLPTFSNSWYKGSPLLSSIIAIVAVIVLVGVLISILYRIPWLLALGCILLTLSVTVFLMLFGGYAISIGFFAGILAVLACSTLTACLFMERMKKQIKNGITPLLGFKRTVRNTILQGIDIHFVSLLVGVLFIFMGNLDLNTMGMFISIGTLFSVLFVLCLWPLISWGIYFGGFKNIKLMMMVGKIKAINATDTQQNQLQTTFTDNKLKWKLNIFNRLAKIIMAVILSAIVVLGVILLTCNSNQSIIKALSNKAIGEYCLSSFYAWMISVSLIALYGLIRLNWTTFVPLLVTLILNSLIPFMLIVITQIPVNSINPEFIIAIALSYQFSAMLTIIFAHNFNNSWIRNHLLSKKLLKNVLNKEILNSLPYLLLTSGITIGSILVSLVLSSNSLLWVYLISLIFVLCSMVMIFSVLPWLLYVFINLRYRYIGGSQRKLDNTFEKRNYDEVDEQEIKDINRFTRAKATI